MVLLHVLHALAPGSSWKLSVAHFNHRLRGRSSTADERFVRTTARSLKLPCDVAGADVRKAAAEQGVSIEMAARQLRHDFLARCAQKRGARLVALAHHADDQVELFLLRLLRGAGGEGLGGMKRSSVSPATASTAPRLNSAPGPISLVRPLLEFSKEEIAAYAREACIQFREDASNASVEFERNWVRLELLPLLRKRQAAVGKNILRSAQIVGADADFVTRMAEAWLKGRSSKSPSGFRPASARPMERGRGVNAENETEQGFGVLHVAVQRRVIQLQIRAFGMEPDFQLIEALRTKPDQAVSVTPDLELAGDANGMVRRVESRQANFSAAQKIIELQKTVSPKRLRVSFGGLVLNWRVIRRIKGSVLKREAGREFFDADQVGSRIILRHWQAGDRFQPIGMASATKLQDWFTNRKVSAARRRQLVLAESERGEVFWVEGERIGEGGKVRPSTRRLLELRWKRL